VNTECPASNAKIASLRCLKKNNPSQSRIARREEPPDGWADIQRLTDKKRTKNFGLHFITSTKYHLYNALPISILADAQIKRARRIETLQTLYFYMVPRAGLEPARPWATTPSR
jgi:hypothetical protein